MSNTDILVIDDEPQICKLLEMSLHAAGFRTQAVPSGKEGIVALSMHTVDLVLLDIGLPDMSGHEVLKEIRTWYEKPVIILSVQNTEQDIVKALDNGANDYIVKPFRTGELLARIRTALRNNISKDVAQLLRFGSLCIDLVNRIVHKNDEELKLTQTEYNLLVLFAQNEGKVLTHRYLLRSVWGPVYTEQTQYLRVFIAQLRKKIEDKIDRPAFIKTEPGVGYRFSG